MSAAPKDRQPWPMKWIVLVIILTVIPYTFITLRYRKPSPAFQPYEDMKNRANVARLLAAGYQRVPIKAQRPADPTNLKGGAAVLPDNPGLPEGLRSTLVEPPILPTEIRRIVAAPSASAAEPYAIELTCKLSDDKSQLGGAELFLHEDRAVIIPTLQPNAGALVSRTSEEIALLTVPPGVLKAGRYMFTAVGEKSSRSWPVEVR